jgi:SAM-dependent methyltransferase
VTARPRSNQQGLALFSSVRAYHASVTFDLAGEPHSEAYFNPQRDYWWNRDYLKLVAARLSLRDVRSVLDVGAGIGHWSTLVLSLLPPHATLMGVERDPRSVERARQRAAQVGLADRCRFIVGVAEALELGDRDFDLVTCQTLLIHVPDVQRVLREMIRVLRPGGVLLAAEPNNTAGILVRDSATVNRPIDELIERIEFELTCERGKQALGEGDAGVADLLPGYFAQAGLLEIRVWLNDKAFPLLPPYQDEDQRALKNAIIGDSQSGRWIWSQEETRRYFVAGGGSESEFERRWQRRINETRRTAQGLDGKALHTAGGGIQYLISGRRAPAS